MFSVARYGRPNQVAKWALASAGSPFMCEPDGTVEILRDRLDVVVALGRGGQIPIAPMRQAIRSTDPQAPISSGGKNRNKLCRQFLTRGWNKGLKLNTVKPKQSGIRSESKGIRPLSEPH